jgi:hypothetical protein
MCTPCCAVYAVIVVQPRKKKRNPKDANFSIVLDLQLQYFISFNQSRTSNNQTGHRIVFAPPSMLATAQNMHVRSAA